MSHHRDAAMALIRRYWPNTPDVVQRQAASDFAALSEAYREECAAWRASDDHDGWMHRDPDGNALIHKARAARAANEAKERGR